MRAAAVGLLVEEQRGEIVASWKRAAGEELGGELALVYAVGPLLREMALELRAGAPDSGTGGGERVLRSAILVRSGASPARVAREFKLLHRSLWEALRVAGRIVPADERRAADEWLDEALAAALDRQDRVRMRIDLLDRSSAVPRPAVGPSSRIASERPPPLPRTRPPPLPRTPPLPVPRTPPLPMAEIIGPLE